MFDGPDYPKPLDEELFDQWLEKGRESKIKFEYMAVIWDDFESKYLPAYIESRDGLSAYDLYGSSVAQESLVAVYDLYSEARISIVNLKD